MEGHNEALVIALFISLVLKGIVFKNRSKKIYFRLGKINQNFIDFLKTFKNKKNSPLS